MLFGAHFSPTESALNLEFCSVDRSRREIVNVLGVCRIAPVVAATWNTQLGW